MVGDWIPRNAAGFNDQFSSRRRRPSFSSALLEAISRSTDPNASRKDHDMRRKSRDSTLAHQHFQLEEQFFCESPRLNTPSWLYCSSEAEKTHSRKSSRRFQDDFRFSRRATMKQEPPLPPPPSSNKKKMKVKPMSPRSKLANFLNSVFTPRKSHEKVTQPSGSFSHSASLTPRSASTPSSKRVSDYKRYDSSCDGSFYANPKPFSVNNSPSAMKTHSHKSDKFCPRNVMLDKNYNRSENENISRDKQHGKHSFLHKQILYEAAEEEEEEDVASDSSSDLFELENLNGLDMDIDLDLDLDLPVFGTTHLETSKRTGLLDKSFAYLRR